MAIAKRVSCKGRWIRRLGGLGRICAPISRRLRLREQFHVLTGGQMSLSQKSHFSSLDRAACY